MTDPKLDVTDVNPSEDLELDIIDVNQTCYRLHTNVFNYNYNYFVIS